MAQYSGSSLSGLASSLETFLPANAHEQPAAIVGQIYEHQVPLHAIDALDRLYGSLYASYHFQALCAPSLLPHAWVGCQRSEIVGVLLFHLEGDRVRVMTEMMALDAEIIAAFCADVFGRFRTTREIDFNAISLPSSGLRLACQHFAFSENYLLDLPSSVGQYEQALGKSTRRTLRGYGNRLLRDHPGFVWHSYPSSALPRHAQRTLVRQLQEFKRTSMASRGKQAQVDARETAHLLQMAADCGMFSLGTIDGKLCAGSLALRIGDNYVMLLCAADPAFSVYRLGMLACYWSLCDCIRESARQCHLLWGRYRYKEQLLAVPVSLHRLRVYRSHGYMLLRPASVISMSVRGALHQARAWLLNDLPRRRDRISRGLLRLVGRLERFSRIYSN